MLKPKKPRPEIWSSTFVAFLAIAGAMLGLTHLVLGQTQTGTLAHAMFQQGGGAFLLVYVISLLVFGVPMMMGWLFLGRRSAKPASTVIDAVRASRVNRLWGWLGPLWQLLAFVLLAVVAGWTLINGPGFWGVQGTDMYHVSGLLVFLVLVFLMGAAGPNWLGRLSAAVTVIIAGLGVVAWVQAAQAHLLTTSLNELLYFRFDLLGWSGLLSALQLALVTASLGGAALWVYGAYLPHKPASLAGWSLGLVLVNLCLTLLVGIGSFALSTAVPMGETSHSLYLIFSPVLALLVGAALAETVTLRFTEKGMKRPLALLIVLGVAGLIAASNLILPWFSDVRHLAVNWLLPVAALLMAVLVGWVLKETQVRKVLAVKSFPLYLATRALMRLLVPLVALVLLIHEVGLW